jgi:FAD binding domain
MNPSQATQGARIVAALKGRFQGRTITPEDASYEPARRVWNGAIDRRPAAIVECADAEDVVVALRAASDEGCEITIRGGGHNVAGRSIRDGAVLIDLSRLRSVVVNDASRIATAQGGALWADVDEATGAFGLATTGGLISTTGVGGFTLGGGAGWLMRRYGLACDNLLGATLVLADGRVVRASASEHPDLFWGLRGGAGGLGVVTSFDFSLHPLPGVLAGLIVYPGDAASTVLRGLRDFADDAPDEFCGVGVITTAPPFPFLDSAWHGKPVAIVAVCWCGQPEDGEVAMAPLLESPAPLAVHVGTMPYTAWQKALDPSAPPGRFNYWKTVNFDVLSDDAIDAIAAVGQRLPTPTTELHVQHLGGAVARVPAADTAFGSRSARFFVNLIGVAESSAGFEAARAGVRALRAVLAPQALATAMPNFTDFDDGDPAAAAGPTLSKRLTSLRAQYDPNGLFSRSFRPL